METLSQPSILLYTGHSDRLPEKTASAVFPKSYSANQIVVLVPEFGNWNGSLRMARGRQKGTYLDTLKRDAGVEITEELRTVMEERDDWRIRTEVRLRPT